MSMMFEIPKLRPVSIFQLPLISNKPFTYIHDTVYIGYRSHQFQPLLVRLLTYNHVPRIQHHNSDHSSIDMKNLMNALRISCRLGRDLCSKGRCCF